MLQDILVTGLVNGGVYALLAIGFSLIFGVARIVNIAHTAFYMLAAYGFYALLVTCTHLGCTPNYLAAEAKFKCPCHGSGFRTTGINFEGPAPRPLERARIVLAEDGQLLVDKARKFQFELGQWTDPEAFLKV